MNRGSSDRATSRTARLALGPAVALALLALAGCDSGGSTPPQPSPVADSGTPSVTMTGVTEAARCSEHRELGRGGDAKLPFADLFGDGVARGIDANDEFVPGPDAADDSKCGQALGAGADAWCAQPPPWVSLDWKDIVNAFGAERIRRISLSTNESGAAADPSTERSATYVEVEVAAGDPKGVARYLQAAFVSCADAEPATVHGVPAVVGTVPSNPIANPSGEAPAVALLTPKRVAWVVLDGRAWTAPERERALKAIASRLSAG